MNINLYLFFCIFDYYVRTMFAVSATKVVVYVAKITSVFSCYSPFCVLYCYSIRKLLFPLLQMFFSGSLSNFELSSARLLKDSVSMSMSLFTASLYRDGQCVSSKMPTLHTKCLLGCGHPACSLHGPASVACVV